MKNLKLYLIAFVTIAFATACQKQGYMPPPEGQRVPYVDTFKVTLKEGLAGSAATHFYAAWQRSNMDAILKAQTKGKTDFTLLVPSNTALQSAGYTLQKLQTMEPKDLDSLLMFYTLRSRITAQELTSKADNYVAPSLLSHAKFWLGRVSGSSPPVTYIYRQQLKLQDGKLYVNGKAAGTGKGIGAKDGQIWFLDQPVIRATKTIQQFVEQDGRFNMLLQIMKNTDTEWNQIYLAAAPGSTPRPDVYNRFGWVLGSQGNLTAIVTETTIFLPTDDAFKAAGFNSVQDLMGLNNRRPKPYYGPSPTLGSAMLGNFATDSLLNYHMFWGKTIALPGTAAAGGVALYNAPIFYSNVMNNNVLANYSILGEYYMPLDFTKDANGIIKVKVKGADAPAASVIEADIPVIQGTVNVVDRLLIPKGFKTN